MFGKFQKSHLRIELEAPASLIGEYLTHPRQLREWFWWGGFSPGLPETFTPGLKFTTTIGLVKVDQKVEFINDHGLCFLLSQGIDGYHEWMWGDGWVQSRLEGISLLPLSLGQTLSLVGLRDHLKAKTPPAS